MEVNMLTYLNFPYMSSYLFDILLDGGDPFFPFLFFQFFYLYLSLSLDIESFGILSVLCIFYSCNSYKYWETWNSPVLLLNSTHLQGKGKRLVDTFSATDLRGCSVAQLQAWLSIDVMEFKQRVSARVNAGYDAAPCSATFQKLVTCHCETSLEDVINMAVQEHVHRVWVVDDEELLLGLVSLSDMLRVIREAVLHDDCELWDIISPKEPSKGPVTIVIFDRYVESIADTKNGLDSGFDGWGCDSPMMNGALFVMYIFWWDRIYDGALFSGLLDCFQQFI